MASSFSLCISCLSSLVCVSGVGSSLTGAKYTETGLKLDRNKIYREYPPFLPALSDILIYPLSQDILYHQLIHTFFKLPELKEEDSFWPSNCLFNLEDPYTYPEPVYELQRNFHVGSYGNIRCSIIVSTGEIIEQNWRVSPTFLLSLIFLRMRKFT